MAGEPTQDQPPEVGGVASDRALCIVVPILAVAAALLLGLLVAVVLSAVVALPAHAELPVEGASRLAEPMSAYQAIIAAVAIGNLVLTALLLMSNRSKAAAERLEGLERALREELAAHSGELIRLRSSIESAVTHDHLAEVYRDIKGIAQQVNAMHGEQTAMNALLRQLIGSRLVGGAK